MECFIKKIFNGEVDKEVHEKFVRFGRGIYAGRAIISLHKTSRLKIKGSYEYANDFVLLASEFNIRFSGIILSKEKLNLENEKKKSGLYSYEVSEIESEKVKALKDDIYYMLLDAENGNLKLKIKKKLPKPGKSGEGKIDDKFCVLEADLSLLSKVREGFFWDVDGKKIKISHDYVIVDLILPKDEKDFAVIRERTKRKGKIIRKIEVDKREIKKEKEFEA